MIRRFRILATAVPLVLALALTACGGGAPTPFQATDESREPSSAPCARRADFATCATPGFENRPYQVYVPTGVDLAAPAPVVLAFHGGTGNGSSAIQTTCPPDAARAVDLLAANCLHQVAEREGFVAVYPNGTGTKANPDSRTFDAGGGKDGWHCVGGESCEKGVDEEAYVTAVLDHLGTWMTVDPGATFATGLSNGGALANRLACTMSPRIAAIASVAGGNQYATTASCEPEVPVAVLAIHGDADPCWTYEQSDSFCYSGASGLKIGAEESATGWADRNGCMSGPLEVTEADVNNDGRATVSTAWEGCQADVVLLRLQGSGHAWPNGWQYLPVSQVGAVSRDWGSERIWAFFAQHRR